MSNRCTGACCRRFVLPATPEKLWENFDFWVKRWRSGEKAADEPPLIQDIHIIAPMAIYLCTVDLDGLPYPLTEQARAKMAEHPDHVYHLYTCKHLLEDGNCSIYEHRPKLCRDYPYGHRCEYAGCEWEGSKHGHDTEEAMTSG